MTSFSKNAPIFLYLINCEALKMIWLLTYSERIFVHLNTKKADDIIFCHQLNFFNLIVSHPLLFHSLRRNPLRVLLTLV